MQPPVDAASVRALAVVLARSTRVETTLYLTGGATAVLEGWRASTIDIDLRLEPDADAVLRALVEAKQSLGINVELASPPDFVPELEGWRDRSPFVLREGTITVRHFDPYSQALAKISRGHEKDRLDVQAMLDTGLVERERARSLFTTAFARLFRYPTIDEQALQRAIDRALEN